MSVDIEDIDDDLPDDYRRANGSPMVMIDGKNERFSRPSGWGKILDDDAALTNWRINTAIKGMAASPALSAKVAALKDGDKKGMAKVQDEAIQAGRGNEASDTGTALHAMTERYEDPEDDFQPPEEFQADLDAYGEMMTRYGLVSEHIEVKMVNVEYRAAGTADRIYRLTKPLVTPDGETLPPGTLVMADLKTGKSLDFSAPGYTVQLAIYAQGSFYNVTDEGDDGRLPTPDIHQGWGLIMHLPVGKAQCTLHWVNLDLGNTGAWLVSEVRKWRNAWKAGRDGHDIPVVDLPGLDVEEIAEKLDAEVVMEDDELWVEMMVPFIKGRIKAIGENPGARQKLKVHWPADTPPPGKLEDPGDVTKVLDLLDKIEAEFGLTFAPGDPRTATSGSHSEMPKNTNQQPSKAQATKDK